MWYVSDLKPYCLLISYQIQTKSSALACWTFPRMTQSPLVMGPRPNQLVCLDPRHLPSSCPASVVAPPNPNRDHHHLSTKHYGLKCLGISSMNLGSSEMWKKEHDLWGPARPGSIFIVLPSMVWLRTLAPELSRTGFKYYSAISYLCDFRQIT